MPLYEYKCLTCGRHTEKRQKFSDPEITQCPTCNGTLERVISAPNISFKGGGWYKDLYSSSSAPKAASATSGDAPAASSGSSESTSTPAPASTPAPSTPAPSTPSTPAKS